MVCNVVADWLLRNSSGGLGEMVEIDKAKFWSVGGTGQCFLTSCPGNARGAGVLLPIIHRWVVPCSTVYTDKKAYFRTRKTENQNHFKFYQHDKIYWTLKRDIKNFEIINW